MNCYEFAEWAGSLLEIAQFTGIDDSVNGLQVACSSKPIKTIAFAVDACADSIARAAEIKADMLFVHHGLLWGNPAPITGTLYERISMLLKHDIALFACHLPLDAHKEFGNNAVIAKRLKLETIEPFGVYHGKPIGWKGLLPSPLSVQEILSILLPQGDAPRAIYPFGKSKNTRVAIVSGGAPFESLQAINEHIDVYITGEPSHSVYHLVKEAGMNMIAGGHYLTEIHGVQAVAQHVTDTLGLSTHFIELPTGL